MKNFIFTLVFSVFTFISFGQNTPKVGDQLVVKSPKAESYKYVDFPKLNILVKRGQLASYNAVIDQVVVVDQVIELNYNTTTVVLKMKDESKFFNLYKTVKANYNKAIESGELVVLKQ